MAVRVGSSPAAGASIKVGSNVTLRALASDTDGSIFT